MSSRRGRMRKEKPNSEERDLIPLLDVFSNALGAAAFLFVVFPALSIDATRNAINPDPSTTTTVGQEAIWMVRITPGEACAFNQPEFIKAGPSLRSPDELIDVTRLHVLVMLRTADQAPTFTVGPLTQDAGCAPMSFTLFASTGEHPLKSKKQGGNYEINVRKIIKKAPTP